MPAPTLTTVSTGGSITASQHNEVTKFLQPNAGDTVTGSFDITFWSSAANQYFGFWLPLAQRTSVPSSCSLPTLTMATGVNFGGVTSVGASGAKIYFYSGGSSNNSGNFGTYTFQY